MRTLVMTLLAVASLWIATAAGASALDWDALNPAWDDTDTSGAQMFANVDGSGIDITVAYTDNMFSNNSVPNIYVAPFAPSPEILGTLRYTNDRATLLETVVSITFSEDVFLNELGTVSLSVIAGLQENMIVEAFDALGLPVFASAYGTNTPGLVQLDVDGDAAYHSRGLLNQEDSQYGDTFYAYTKTPVRELRYTLFVTEVGGDDIVRGWSSQGIGDIDFTVVPEPTTALLVGLGLVALAGRKRVQRG